MNRPGFITVVRSFWDDQNFRDGEMTQREAFLWMLAEAAWRPREKAVGGAVVSLQRGELAASTRYLAKAWQWSEPRVRRYLNMLKNRRTVQTKTDAGVTVVTICNYDKFQHGGDSGDAPATQEMAQERRTSDANQNKGTNKQDNLNLSAAADSWKSDHEFCALWDLWPEQGRKRSDSREKLYPKFCRARKKHGFDLIIRGARLYVRSPDCQKSGGQGLNPWLNQERYLNFADQAGPRPVSSGSSSLQSIGVAT